MAKSKKVVSKKAQTEVVGPVLAPVVPASEPVQAEAVPPPPVSVPVPRSFGSAILGTSEGPGAG
jgi:hypothetical protein